MGLSGFLIFRLEFNDFLYIFYGLSVLQILSMLLDLSFTVKIVIQRGKPFGVIFVLFLLIRSVNPDVLDLQAAQSITVAASCLLSFSVICQHIT